MLDVRNSKQKKKLKPSKFKLSEYEAVKDNLLYCWKYFLFFLDLKLFLDNNLTHLIQF